MIARVWHGYTSFENASAYENFLKTEFMPSVEKKYPGLQKVSVIKERRS